MKRILAKPIMTRTKKPKKNDAGKTMQHQIDDLQNELALLRRRAALLGGIIDISSDAIISIDEQQ